MHALQRLTIPIAAAAAVAWFFVWYGQAQPDLPRTLSPEASSAAPLVVPADCRLSNYAVGHWRHREGSCLHTACQDLLLLLGHEREADQWRRQFGGGLGVRELAVVEAAAIADRLGLHPTYTTSGDQAFLEQASATRRGAAIVWEAKTPGDHAIVFIGYEAGQAVLLGTNRPVLTYMPKAAFLAQWHRCYGQALSFVDPPITSP